MDTQTPEIVPTPAAEDERTRDRIIGRRIVLAGVAGLGMASLIGLNAVLAQDSTDDTDDSNDDTDDSDSHTTDDDDSEVDAEIGATYQNFLAKLTTNLGMTDTAEVDLAIRSSLKSMVDEKFTEGSISQNDADAIKERIDIGASPLGVAMLAGMRGRGMERRRKRRNEEEADDGIGSDTAPAGRTSEATLPA